jgi:hypothetical protein
LPRKTHGLDRYHLAEVLRGAGIIQRHSMTRKDPPGLLQPEQPKDKESVLHHPPWRLMASHREFQKDALLRQQPQWRFDSPLAAGKLVMG